MRISVGRRLAALVACEALLAGLLLILGVGATRQTDRRLQYSQRFVLAPVRALSEALEDAADLNALVEPSSSGRSPVARQQELLAKLEKFAARYRREWTVADNPSRDAQLFRDAGLQQGHGATIERQKAIVDNIERLRRSLAQRIPLTPAMDGTIGELRASLRQLLSTHADLIDFAQQEIMARNRTTRLNVIFVGISTLFVAVLLGIAVQRAIAPRIRRLVDKTRRFQEFGAFERDLNAGADEIGVLSNALDAGFQAIAARDRERERFLAVAAHELKTPLTSILGFAQAALEHPDQTKIRERALVVIRRHATRLRSLIDELFYAAASRSGKLEFHPDPLDLVAVTRRVATELEISQPTRVFAVHAPEHAYLLADEALLSQALWSMFSYACALAPAAKTVHITLESNNHAWNMEVKIDRPSVSESDLEQAFSPFATVQYEGSGSVRTVNGLFFCREMAHVHGGHLRLYHEGIDYARLNLELPA